MIARINTGAKPSGAVYYNEYKVAHGEARYLGGFNAIPFEREDLRVEQKIDVLALYAAGNPNISKPTFHVSLAFHPNEQLSDERLTEIGQAYMERLGYGDQPYLVYRHEDTHHPHIHMVSVSVDGAGKRISDSHQQRRSNAIRQALEKQFGLLEAEQQGKTLFMDGLLPEQVLSYREPEAKKAIGNVVLTAMKDYNFSNMVSFKAFLQQHRVQLNEVVGSDAGGAAYHGISFQLHQGGVGDKQGEGIGPAIKASRFSFAPTQATLSDKFKKNTARIERGKESTRQRISQALASYLVVSEADFKGELRALGIQVIDTGEQYVYVDHQHRNVYGESELGKPYHRATYQQGFGVESQRIGKGTKAKPNPQPTKTKDIVNKVPTPTRKPSTQQPPASNQPTATQVALVRRVSHHYQQLRQTGIDGQPPVYFESQLIWQFPFMPLVQALVGEGAKASDAHQAVSDFEAYKQSRLVALRAQEEAYVQQQATLFMQLAAASRISEKSKRDFLYACGFKVATDGLTLSHRHDSTLTLNTTPAFRQSVSKEGTGVDSPRVDSPDLLVPDTFSKQERSIYVAMATGRMPEETLSFYQLPATRLKHIGGAYFEQVAPALNQAYSNQIATQLPPTGSLFKQLQARGMVIDKLASGQYRIGHYQTAPSCFVEVDRAWANRLATEAVPTLANQQRVFTQPNGQLLVALSMAIDKKTQSSKSVQAIDQLAAQARVLLGESADKTPVQLQLLLAKQLDKPSAVVQPTPTKLTPTVPPVPSVDSYGKALITRLTSAPLTPQERYSLVLELGFVWQKTASGGLMLQNQQASPTAHYTLSTTEAAFFQPVAADNTVATYRLTQADKRLIQALCLQQPIPSLSPQQLAGLTLPVISKLLPDSMRRAVETNYNQQRGHQILSDTHTSFGASVSARRLLSALYQRGFLVRLARPGQARPGQVHQPSDVTRSGVTRSGETRSGETQFQLGHYSLDKTSFVPMPESIKKCGASRLRPPSELPQ